MKDWTKLKGLISKGFKKVEKLEPNETDVFTIPSMEKEDAKEDSTKDGLIEGFYDNGQLEWNENWKDGKEHGRWENYFKNGKLQLVENFKEGKLNGPWTSYYESGQILTRGNNKDGHHEGLEEGFYENGQLEHKGNYKKPTSEFNFLGDKDGLWEYFDEEGNLTKTEKYMNGELVD